MKDFKNFMEEAQCNKSLNEPVQSQECYRHHMLLKDQLTRINNLLFGNPDKPEDLSITNKVNLMFNILVDIKKWAIGAVFTFAGCLIFLGSHFAKMENIADKLDNHIQKTENSIQNLTTRVDRIEERMK